MRKKLIWLLSGLIMLLLIICGSGYYYFIQMPLPQTDGTLQIAGLRAPVEVIRDRWGVPHIYAKNEHDLFMAQGFVQAQDRLWQMEVNRRMAAGRLSEILGSQTIEVDKLLRIFGFLRAARQEIASYDAFSMAILNAFAEGVNAYIKSKQNFLPLEFKLLKVKPDPWRPEDSIAWAKVMAFFGSKNWQEEIVRSMLVKKVGMAKTRDLLDRIAPWAPPTVPAGLSDMGQWPIKMKTITAAIPTLGGASNNWAVHGSRTDTGLPLLANDMHLPLNIPSTWYEIHLVGGKLDIIGLSLPGVPLVVAGHNRQIAWGITFAYTDIQDVFFERLDPERKGYYLYKNQWSQAAIIDEKIKVKGQAEPIAHSIWLTRHGPIISPQSLKDQDLEYAISLKWSADQPGDMISSVYQLNCASNWQEFKIASQHWAEPAINLVYADKSGNIGYVLASRIPIRAQGHGRGPFEGWTGSNEWAGFVAPDQKPFMLNPTNGLIATANHQVVDERFPYYLAEDYATGYRAARIMEVLEQKQKISITDIQKLQGDLKCLPADRFILALDQIRVQDAEAQTLLKHLRAWNQVLSPDSIGGAIYVVLYYKLIENTFQDELGSMSEMFFGVGLTPIEPLNRFVQHSRIILLSLMSDRHSFWFDNIETPDKENFQNILEQSLVETAQFLKNNLGPTPADWRWGHLHQVEIKHLLGQVKPLDRLFNLGPYAGSGHFATVRQSAAIPGMDFKHNGWTVSHRHIYDLQNWDQSLGTIVPGQSGMIGSPHYADQMKLWLDVKHHPLCYSRLKVDSVAKHILYLIP